MNGFGGGLVVFLALIGITQAMIIVPHWQKLEELDQLHQLEKSEPEEQVLEWENQFRVDPIRKVEVEFPDFSTYQNFVFKKLKNMRHFMRMAPYKG